MRFAHIDPSYFTVLHINSAIFDALHRFAFYFILQVAALDRDLQVVLFNISVSCDLYGCGSTA